MELSEEGLAGSGRSDEWSVLGPTRWDDCYRKGSQLLPGGYADSGLPNQMMPEIWIFLHDIS